MIEWDAVKRRINLEKHGVDFAAAAQFAWDSAMVAADDRFDYGEDRFVAIGWIAGVAHTMVFARRGANIRIISLRRSSRTERKLL